MAIAHRRAGSDSFREALSASPVSGDAVFPRGDGWRWYRSPVAIIRADTIDDVVPALESVELHIRAGKHAAGYLRYEAAPAFDSALEVFPSDGSPLLWFGIYTEYIEEPTAVLDPRPATPLDWSPSVSRSDYDAALSRVHDLIAAGDTYQVNVTFSLTVDSFDDTWARFCRIAGNERAGFSAYIDAGVEKILSFSPELFFRLDGDRLLTRPMKGTAHRGLWFEDDLRRADALRSSPKERAENVMIVDMLRNDLGRVSRTGSVRVESLFDVERYDTLWQMTSSISAETEATVPEIFRALFPSASVTGAPKVRTMEIIRGLESGPRGVYCGAVGWWGPERQAEFNVAIRTMTVDGESNGARYHVGGGITWDSVTEDEYDECRLKAEILTRTTESFELIESFLWDGELFLLELHLERLGKSAEYFAFPFDEDRITKELRRYCERLGSESRKVRLLLSKSGVMIISDEATLPPTPLRAGFADGAIDAGDRFLYHKTTRRDHFAALRVARPEWDDVLCWNGAGEVTEGTFANLVAEVDGRRVTPPIRCGLLAGVMRKHLIESGDLVERALTKDDVCRADRLWLINSVRKWIPLMLVDEELGV